MKLSEIEVRQTAVSAKKMDIFSVLNLTVFWY